MLLLLLLQMIRGQEVTIDSLGNGPGLLPFNLGPTRVVSHYHSFLNYVNLDSIQTQINLVNSKMSEFRPKLNNKTSFLFEPHFNYLSSKLSKISIQLESFEHGRYKRGLIDGLGSIIKSISGNLDQMDAIRYNNAIRILEENEHKLEVQFNQHVSLSKNWALHNEKLLTNITENQIRISHVLNRILNSREPDLVHYAHMAQYLIMLNDYIESLSEERYRLEYTLAFIRASSTPHSIISLAEIRNMLDRLRTLYSNKEILDLEFRDYYDVIRLGYFYIDNQIVIVFKMPIIFPPTYTLYKLSIVPNKYNKILLPILPFIAITEHGSMYIEAECPKINSLYLCEAKMKHQVQGEPDCIQHLITSQELQPSCKLTSVTLKRQAVEQLDEKHYTMSFPFPAIIKISCGHETYKTLEGSYLATIPHNCHIRTPEFTLANSNNHIKGFALEIMQLPTFGEAETSTETPFVLDSLDLENLHSINKKISLQTPVKLNDSSDASLYHTTIPIYIILFGAVILTGTLIYRRRYGRHHPYKAKSTELDAVASSGNYAEIRESNKVIPSKIAINHSTISSSLPTPK